MVADGPEGAAMENVSGAASAEVLITGAAASRSGVMSPPALAEFELAALRPAPAAAALAAGATGLTTGFGVAAIAGGAFTTGALTAGAGFGGVGAFWAGCPGLAAA